MRGANVFIGCRSEERMNSAIESITKEIESHGGNGGTVSGFHIDLQSFDSVRSVKAQHKTY